MHLSFVSRLSLSCLILPLIAHSAAALVDVNVSVQNAPPSISGLLLSTDGSSWNSTATIMAGDSLYLLVVVSDANSLSDLDSNASQVVLWNAVSSSENASDDANHYTLTPEDDGAAGLCNDAGTSDGVWCSRVSTSAMATPGVDWSITLRIADSETTTQSTYAGRLTVTAPPTTTSSTTSTPATSTSTAAPTTSTPPRSGGGGCSYRLNFQAPYYATMYPGESEEFTFRLSAPGCSLGTVRLQGRLPVGDLVISRASVRLYGGDAVSVPCRLTIPAETGPGLYKGSFLATSGRVDVEHPFSVKVLPPEDSSTTLPPASTTTLAQGLCLGDKDCLPGGFCLAGVCESIECTADEDCMDGEFCLDRLCAALNCPAGTEPERHGCVIVTTTSAPASSSLAATTTLPWEEPAPSRSTYLVIAFLVALLATILWWDKREQEPPAPSKETGLGK